MTSEEETLLHVMVLLEALAKFERFKVRAGYHLALLNGKVDYPSDLKS